MIINIDKINLYMTNIKVHFICLKVYFIYFIYPHLIFYLNQKYFNTLKSILYIKKLAIS